MRFLRSAFVAAIAIFSVACTENYANGERIGLVTQFSKAGYFFKSWEGHLNLTQTGMNSSVPFDFSIDNDREDPIVIALLDSAATLGWKVKLTYHQTQLKNWFLNRGETDHFITKVEVLDKNMSHPLSSDGNGGNNVNTRVSSGKAVDTIYVVIVGRSSEGYKRP